MMSIGEQWKALLEGLRALMRKQDSIRELNQQQSKEETRRQKQSRESERAEKKHKEEREQRRNIERRERREETRREESIEETRKQKQSREREHATMRDSKFPSPQNLPFLIFYLFILFLDLKYWTALIV